MPLSAFIIVKYASADMRDFYYQKNYRFTQGDSAHLTFTARQVGLPMQPFSSREEAQPWLDKMIELNPSVGYDIVEIKLKMLICKTCDHYDTEIEKLPGRSEGEFLVPCRFFIPPVYQIENEDCVGWIEIQD